MLVSRTLRPRPMHCWKNWVHSNNYAAKFVHTQTCPFQHYYRLSSVAGFRSSLQPSWSLLIFSYSVGGVIRFPVPKWLLFLNCCRQWFFLILLLVFKSTSNLFKLLTNQTCPLCPQVDSALHILCGCQHTQIRNMTTERHNLACRMIFKAISKTGSLGSCVVSMDISSNERMTMQNLQMFETAESRNVPKWLFVR